MRSIHSRLARAALRALTLATFTGWGSSAGADAAPDGSAAAQADTGGTLPWNDAPWGAPDARVTHRPRRRSFPTKLASPPASISLIASTKGDGCLYDVVANLSKDGQDLALSYYFHELHLEAGSRHAQGLCTTRIELESDVPVSFAVSRVRAQGFAKLDLAVEARLGLRYYGPDGRASSPVERVLGAARPGERQAFQLERDLEAELVWSPCGRRSEVELRTLFELSSPSGEGNGWVDMCRATTDGRPGEAGLRLSWRACEPGA